MPWFRLPSRPKHRERCGQRRVGRFSKFSIVSPMIESQSIQRRFMAVVVLAFARVVPGVAGVCEAI